MKSLVTLCTAILCICLFFSCTKKTDCTDSGEGFEFQFYRAAISDTISDTSATVIEYIKGSNFTKPRDSFPNIRFAQQYVPFSDHRNDVFNYDWMVILYPSAKSYTVKNVQHDNRSITQDNEDDKTCTNDVFYTTNDSLFQIQGGTGSAGSDYVFFIRY